MSCTINKHLFSRTLEEIKGIEKDQERKQIGMCLFSQLIQSDCTSVSFKQLARTILLLRHLNVEAEKVIQLVNIIGSKNPLPHHAFLALKRLSFPRRDVQTVEIALHQKVTNENADTVLWYAVETGNYKLAQSALNMNANPNCLRGDNDSTSPLLLASKNGWAEIVTLLMKHGAKPQFVGGMHKYETPYREALRHGEVMQSCLPSLLKADGGFSKEVTDINVNGHLLGIDRDFSISGEPFFTSGLRSRYFLPQFLSAAADFYNNMIAQLDRGPFSDHLKAISDDQKQRLIATLETIVPLLTSCETYLHKPIETVMQQLDNGTPVPLYGITKTEPDNPYTLHYWALLIVKEKNAETFLVYRCNRGSGCGEYPGVLISRCDRQQVEKLCLRFQELNEMKEHKTLEGDPLEEIDHSLLLSGKVGYLPQKPQKGSNCTYTTLGSLHFSALYDALRVLFEPPLALYLSKTLHKKLIESLQNSLLFPYLELPHKEAKTAAFEFLVSMVQAPRRNGRLGLLYQAALAQLKSEWLENNCPMEYNLLLDSELTDHYREWLLTLSSRNPSLFQTITPSSYPTVIQSVIDADDDKALNTLLQGEFSLTIQNEPLLHYAVSSKSTRCIKFLIQTAGIDVNAPNCYGRTPLWNALYKDYDAIARLLLKKGAKVYVGDNGKNFLIFQAFVFLKRSTIELMIDRLLKEKSSPSTPPKTILNKRYRCSNAYPQSSMTFLMRANYLGRQDIVDLLEKKGEIPHQTMVGCNKS